MADFNVQMGTILQNLTNDTEKLTAITAYLEKKSGKEVEIKSEATSPTSSSLHHPIKVRQLLLHHHPASL